MQEKRPETCRYPCKCPKDPPRCKTSRTVKDGCDCCRVCPRQQGDLCDDRHVCDDNRQLYCHFNVDAGHRGICRGGWVPGFHPTQSTQCTQRTHLSPRFGRLLRTCCREYFSCVSCGGMHDFAYFLVLHCVYVTCVALGGNHILTQDCAMWG